MTKNIIAIGLLLFLTTGQFAFGQNNKVNALEKGKTAIRLEGEEKFKEAIKLFEEAQKLDPDKLSYPYEIEFCYMQMSRPEISLCSLCPFFVSSVVKFFTPSTQTNLHSEP